MLRPIAFTASVVLSIAALSGLLSTLPAEAQTFRGNVATATFSMACFPNSSKQTGNIIIYATGAQQVPAGTAVTVTWMEPLSTSWFGAFGWIEKTTVYRTKHAMGSYDPEVVGVRGYCLSATYTSNKPVLAW